MLIWCMVIMLLFLKFGGTEGQYVDETGREDELTTGMILGPYFMFRKSILEKSGDLMSS